MASDPVTPPLREVGTHEQARAYIQQRLALFTKLWFCLLPVFVISVMGLYEVYPHLRPARSTIVHVVAAGTLIPLAAVWYFALHRRQVSLPVLYAIDGVNLVGIGGLFGLSAYVSSDLRVALYTTFIWHTFLVFGRVFVVPSTARRTAVITAASYLPLMGAALGVAVNHPTRLELPGPAFVIGSVFFAGAAVALAAIGSNVIFGLRKQVDEARTLGRYTLERKIGEGGMGAVWRARHAMLRRPTAVKLLPPDRNDPRSLGRFEREVQAMSRLTHPNTVAVFDYGRSDDGVFYYAMEYLDGVDLETLIRDEGALPAARVVHLLVQVCGALDEAHALGLIHRDIKPGNIIVCQRGQTPDVVKVVDFGLVKELKRTDDATRTGVIAGTPAYISPEAVTDPERVGAHSDLYGVGAVAYFLLTGHRVFDGATDVHVCAQHASAIPVPPSERTTATIPPALEALVLACLAKEPGDRPASAKALAEALAATPGLGAWTDADATAWWAKYAEVRAARSISMAAALGPTLSASDTIDPVR